MIRRSALAFALMCCACGEDAAPPADLAEPAPEANGNADASTPPPSPERPFAKGRFAPRDECGKLPGAAAFRNRLAEAVRLRDAEAVSKMATPDVELDFGGGAGREELEERLGGPGGELWQELDALLTLGCTATPDGGLALPWVWNQDLGDLDPFAALLVTGEDEPVRESAARAAKEIAKVSWDYVEVADFRPDAAYQQVKLADGRTGYVASEKLRSAIGYRLIAERQDGAWRIVAFIAGD